MFKDIYSQIKLPDIFSLTCTVFTALSMFFVLEQRFQLFTLFIVIAIVFDYLDGKVARAVKRKGDFGKVLDSLNDVFLYLIVMVLFGYSIGMNNMMSIIFYIIFIISGILRLARFTLRGTVSGCYQGLPVSYVIIIPFLYFIFLHFNININYLIWFYFIPAFLMISTIKIKKKFPYF